MKWFNNLKIKFKLLISFTFLSALTAFVGVQGLTNMDTINNMLNVLYTNETLGISFIKEANINLIYHGRALNNFLLSSSDEDRNTYQARIDEYEKGLMRDLEKAKPLITTEQGIRLISEFESAWNEYRKVVDQIIEKASMEELYQRKESVNLAMTVGREKVNLIDTILTRLSRLKEENGKQAFEASDVVYAEARLYMILLIFGAVGLGIGLGFIISNLISKPLQKLTQVANQVSVGDVDVEIHHNSDDEIGKLMHAFKDMTNNIKDQVTVANKISEGNLNVTVKEKSDKDQLSKSFIKVLKTLNDLVAEARLLTKAAVEGRLDTRGNSNGFYGGYKEIVDGVNSTLDAVIKPVQEGRGVLELMAEGDLTPRVTGTYMGDHQILKQSINKLGESLSRVIGQVNEAVQATASSSAQISSSTEEMAAGAQEQSSQTTEIAGAVEEMTKTILQTSTNTASAAEQAKKAGFAANEGGLVIKETIQGMNKIAEVVKNAAATVLDLGASSEQIGSIIQVIDDIADQTNLLALNAAIEAARAGEHGRGFAVVADEVRKLAERTSKATKEIGDMIIQIQKKTNGAVNSMELGTKEVENGIQLAQKSGKSLSEIIESTNEVVDVINQVAAASEEQSSAAEQISKSIEGISSVTQESAAGVQQIAHAAGDLNNLTVDLQKLIEQFKIDHEHSNAFDSRTFKKAKQLSVRSNGVLVNS